MRYGYVRSTLLLLCTAALAGCGLTSSPADNLTFKAPAGWSASPGIMGYMQFWKASDDEMLMLFKSPKEISEKDVFSSAKLNDATIVERKDVTICNGQHAAYMLARGTATETTSTGGGVSVDKKTQSYVQAMETDANGTTYFALYIYPVDAKPNAEAVAALRQLCPKT